MKNVSWQAERVIVSAYGEEQETTEYILYLKSE